MFPLNVPVVCADAGAALEMSSARQSAPGTEDVRDIAVQNRAKTLGKSFMGVPRRKTERL
jgi:hypothetical protein